MTLSLLLALAALRGGLQLRRARRRRIPAPRGARQTHVRVAKLAVAMLLVGALAGPASTYWLRGWTPFETFHGLAGAAAGVLFALTAHRGLALERGAGNEPRARDLHAILALAAVGCAAVAAFAGFVLLP